MDNLRQVLPKAGNQRHNFVKDEDGVAGEAANLKGAAWLSISTQCEREGRRMQSLGRMLKGQRDPDAWASLKDRIQSEGEAGMFQPDSQRRHHIVWNRVAMEVQTACEHKMWRLFSSVVPLVLVSIPPYEYKTITTIFEPNLKQDFNYTLARMMDSGQVHSGFPENGNKSHFVEA